MLRYNNTAIQKALTKATESLAYSSLRQQQDQAVTAFMQGSDVFICLLTGSGKSLCYTILPAVYDALQNTKSSIVVVVSPLIALMKDQVHATKERGMRTVFVGDCDEEETANVCAGSYQLVYLSPKVLLTNEILRDMLLCPVYTNNLVALVVDEAQCVKKWGETFRKEFLAIGEVRSLVPSHVNMMALMATATKTTQRAVCKLLGMVQPKTISLSPNRTNIKYFVIAAANIEENFAALVEEVRRQRLSMDRTIIFCRTYDDSAHIYLFLRSRLGRECVEPIGAPDLAEFRLSTCSQGVRIHQ